MVEHWKSCYGTKMSGAYLQQKKIKYPLAQSVRLKSTVLRMKKYSLENFFTVSTFEIIEKWLVIYTYNY